MRSVLAVVACVIVGCRPPPRASPPEPLPIASVDAGTSISAAPPTPQEEREQLATLLEETIAFIEEARPRCSASDSAAAALQAEAAAYADRDEVTLRNRAGDWPPDRRVDEWLRRRRETVRELRALVASRCASIQR